jgi:hypothetical protein
MAAHGLAERRNTVARLTNAIQPVGDRVYRSAVPDGEDIPRNGDGTVLPHIIIDFGAPVKAARDRNIANAELGQPHVLPANVLCVAGDADTADAVMAAVVNLLVDWAPSATSDPWEAKGGYGTNRPSTGNTPTRFGSGLFLECVVNQGVN